MMRVMMRVIVHVCDFPPVQTDRTGRESEFSWATAGNNGRGLDHLVR